MGKAIWSGTVGFGMVSIPVKLYTSAKSEDIAFNELHVKCGSRTGRLVVCKTCMKDDSPVLLTPADIIKGYEHSKGEYVTLTAEELAALPLPAKETISIDRFVDASEIDPLQFEHTYYLGPDKGPAASKALALLLHALEEKGKLAVSTVAIRKREQLCVLRGSNGLVLLHTMFWPTEIKVEKQVAPPLSEQEIMLAGTLVDALSKPFDPSAYSDRYESALRTLIQQKLEGGAVVVAPATAVTAAAPFDLSALLAASLSKVAASGPTLKVTPIKKIKVKGGKVKV